MTIRKILLIDDNKELTTSLKSLLEMESFELIVAHDAKEAFSLLDNSINMVLIDTAIPKMNGIDILKELRKIYEMPVIILGKTDSNLDLILSLELGADDYLAKPFNNRELIARIRAVLRRTASKEKEEIKINPESIVNIDDLQLNLGKQEARFSGQVLDLTGTEFSLSYLLAKNVGQVVSKEQISQSVLGKRLAPFDRAIDMHISNLRRKLPERKDRYPWFKTLRGRGYLMVSEA
ncbi:envelope stress response regulator transcription factor CpxR [Candidatus Hamiltonella defensa]|uniref:Response regulator in two-component regulatory system with CpxA n=2 Tax=Candidatus Williamhamiltonella defendens TaxID=138072 RepID=C4K755_HAMD5|nr:response regulator in two-component regulatory system with CpxA [Candidatus Hamiltonella defensa 5AT (Acyrthosiphon pisum)]ASV33567.1 DNA-binding response regulator [Candidatus Hamiltonella defensa]AWK16521.1 DNA-binding response regulator [Candidatus Hamiltonella defensa]AYB49402.1 DNA-binding response regulator [Candidatus Hamiltonella defensa]MBK4361935.1 envelope stress response regulator transcription factor CpxR [Candidatus Hamiltonella defensa]